MAGLAAADIAELHGGKATFVVSSGRDRARTRLNLARRAKLEDSGRRRSDRSRSRVLGRGARPPFHRGRRLADAHRHRGTAHYLNARSTIGKLLEWRSVPVINENDTVATSEPPWRHDRLPRASPRWRARPAGAASDIDGLYAAASRHASQSHSMVERITPEIEAWRARPPGIMRGGMTTKIEAGKIATTAASTW